MGSPPLEGVVEDNFDEQLKFLRKLVESPSFTEHPDDVEEASLLIDKEMKGLGFTRVLYPARCRASHRIYSSAATHADDKALALVGHVDTVYEKRWSEPWRYGPTLADDDELGMIYGPGVLDMKGGLSVIVFALKALQAARPEVFGGLKVRFLMNTDEEKGSRTSRRMFKDSSTLMTGALVFENGRDDDEIVIMRKGIAPFEITAKVDLDEDGKPYPQHAGGKHREGSNALHALMLAGHLVESMTDYGTELTFNVTIKPKVKINSDMTRNVMPNEAALIVDCRYNSTVDLNRALDLLRDRFAEMDLPGLKDMKAELIERVKRTKLSFELEPDGRPPMHNTPANTELCERYSRHARDCDLGSGPAPLQGGGSDANLLADMSVPVIDGLGPFGKGAHSVGPEKEWIDPESLKKRTKALARFLLEEVDIE